MGRFAWIFGLSIALLFYGSLTVGAVFLLAMGHHLSLPAWALLAVVFCAAFVTLKYLRQQISQR